MVYVNPAFLQMWRIADAREVVGKKVMDFASNQEVTARGLQAIKEKGSWASDLVASRADGSSFDAHLVGSQVTGAEGQPCYLMASFIDLTERKQLEKELKEHRDQLEMRVQERTAEITAMNERLKILSRRLIEIQEKERYNLARELHDQIGQSLNMIKMLLDRVSSASDEDRRVFRSQALGMLTELIDRVSDLSLELRPRILDDLGLARALEWYFSNFTKQTNVRVQFTPSVIDKLPLSTANSIYRVVQEALTNVARHARAKSVAVRFKYARGRLQLNVEDDGIGFEPAAVNTAMLGGIINMRERVGLLGGTLQLESEPGAGTRLYAEIPYRLQHHGKGGPKDGNHRHRR